MCVCNTDTCDVIPTLTFLGYLTMLCEHQQKLMIANKFVTKLWFVFKFFLNWNSFSQKFNLWEGFFFGVRKEKDGFLSQNFRFIFCTLSYLIEFHYSQFNYRAVDPHSSSIPKPIQVYSLTNSWSSLWRTNAVLNFI